jgi:hypothetical protein
VTKATKSISNGVTKSELGNLFENFKTDIMNTFGSQIDTSKAKKKQEEQYQVLSIYFPKCRKKTCTERLSFRQNSSLWMMYIYNHATVDCLRLKELQATHIEEGQGMESLYYLAPRKPWQPRFTGMSQNFAPQFSQQFP